jgi:hypothetical protein
LTIGWLGSVIVALLLVHRHPGDTIEAYIAPLSPRPLRDEAIGLNSAAIPLSAAKNSPARAPQLAATQAIDKQGFIADEVHPIRFSP